MKISMIYLAAGNSRRFGSNKLLARLDGRPLYRYGLEALMGAAKLVRECSKPEEIETEILVVSRDARILEAARVLGLIPVESPDSALGMSFSIRAGLERAGGDYCLFQAADQPFLRPETIAGLIRHTLEAGARIGMLRCGGENRNPVLFHSSLREGLWALEGDQGGRLVAKRHWEEVCVWETEGPEQFRDIDVPEDLKRSKKN